MQESIITKDMEHCFICRRPATDNHHCLFGSKRAMADKHKLVVGLCRDCHNKVHNPRTEAEQEMQNYLKREAQFAFEDKVGSREDFRKIFGRSYLSWQEHTQR